MSQKQRITNHNGRKGDGGHVITDRHNDRNFELENAEHIDPQQTQNNMVWIFQPMVMKNPNQQPSQAEYEQAVYEHYFSDFLDSRNETYIKSRHRERVQTMEQFRKNPLACPEESIISVGNMETPCDPEILRQIYDDYVDWHKQAYPQVMLLNAYMHLDEASPHIHQRQIWTAHDGDMLIISQRQSLEEMGVNRLDPEKKESRYNNAKMTYTKDCRAKLSEIAKSYGLDIVDEPRDKSRSGLSMLKYKAQQLEKRLKTLTEELSEGRTDKEKLLAEIDETRQKLLENIKKQEDIDKRPPSRPEPYVPECPSVGESRGDYRKRLKAAEKDHKAWEKEQKIIAKWDREHPKGYDTITAAILAEKEKALNAREAALQAREALQDARDANYTKRALQGLTEPCRAFRERMDAVRAQALPPKKKEERSFTHDDKPTKAIKDVSRGATKARQSWER